MTPAIFSSLLTEDEALSLIESTIQSSQAEGIFVSLSLKESALSRFSENQISQNIGKNCFKMIISSYFGQKSASASTTELDPDAILQTLRRSEALAQVAPDDPEWVPLLAPQSYESRFSAFDKETATLSPLMRGALVKQVCSSCKQAGVEGSGILGTEASVQAIGNSLGLQGFCQTTEAEFSLTARTDGASSWHERTAWSLEDLPIADITAQVIERGLASRNQSEVLPGVYPVVFEGAAFAELLSWLMWNLDARAADEGRSFLSCMDASGQPRGNRLGEALFSPLVQIQRHPSHPLLQAETFFDDGMSNGYLEVIKDGILQNLSYSRYWAQATGNQPTGMMFPFVMQGSQQRVEDLIAQTERGILVSRAWYVRYVNPQTLEVTGMTRDGTFWLEDGKIAYPIKNLRFNQSLPQMLADVEALSQVQRFGRKVVPGVKVKAFNFSSITDSI